MHYYIPPETEEQWLAHASIKEIEEVIQAGGHVEVVINYARSDDSTVNFTIRIIINKRIEELKILAVEKKLNGDP